MSISRRFDIYEQTRYDNKSGETQLNAHIGKLIMDIKDPEEQLALYQKMEEAQQEQNQHDRKKRLL